MPAHGCADKVSDDITTELEAEATMDAISTTTEDEALDLRESEELIVRAWRAEQLGRLGLPPALAKTFADLVDWHALADLLDRGCPLGLALDIVR